jgi:NAD(P)-dependent dehydrogenase (short-subunit alcohol dehydrogenase family)
MLASEPQPERPLLEVFGLRGALAGQTSVITGAAMGVGEELARCLARAGSRVALLDVEAVPGERVADSIRRDGGTATFHACDVSDESQLVAVLRAIEADHGAIHVLVNNAVRMLVGSLAETSIAEWDAVQTTNLRAVYVAVRQVLPGMQARRRGVVMNVIAPEGGGFHAAYSSSKAGVRAFTQSVARELGADSGVAAVSFFPGVVDTPGMQYNLARASQLLGMTEAATRASFARNPGYSDLMPASHCAAAQAYLIVHAGEYHGQVANPFEPLQRFGVIAADTPLSRTQPDAGPALDLTSALRQMVATVEAENRELETRIQARTAELAAAKQELEETNRQLEERVAQQVAQIVARAKEVDALSQQLQLRVQERSRELARALGKVGGRGDSGLPAVGELFAGRVEIRALLGVGGMGVVYRGHDRVADQEVALKLIRPSAATDPAALRRFFAESLAASAVRHPGIVGTLHVDVAADGTVFQIMELVRGATLGRHLERGPLPPPLAARLTARVSEALAAAHGAGVVHRDLKPANLIVTSAPPGVKVLDFGLAKLAGEELGATLGLQTHGNQLMGTPLYMSPEQISDPAGVTPATDIYSLGVVLFEAVAGRPPFEAGSVAGLCMAHLGQRPPNLDDLVPGLPPALAETVHTCLEKGAAARPAAGELARRLEAIADQHGAPPAEQVLPSFDLADTLAASRP